jgi:hypothetical protein
MTPHALPSRLWRAPGRWFWLGVWAAVFGASLWQYRGTLGAGFEGYDPGIGAHDSRMVLRLAREPTPVPYFARTFSPAGAFYRPGSVVWYWTLCRLLGDRPTAWRVFALATHAAAATLLAILLSMIAGSRAPGVLAAGWFVWRGEHWEVITWLAAQVDTAMAALCLAALVALWREQWNWRWRVAGSSLLALMALLTKESAVAVLAFIAATAPLWPISRGPRARALALGAFGLAGAIYLAARVAALGALTPAPQTAVQPPMGANLHAYLHLAWPPAAWIRAFPPLSLGWMILLVTPFWKCLFDHAVYYGGAVLLLWRAWRPTALFALWILLTPLPALPSLIMGSRYEYLASMGWAALAGLLIWQSGQMAVRFARARRGRALASA